jgi:hypothetical protein
MTLIRVSVTQMLQNQMPCSHYCASEEPAEQIQERLGTVECLIGIRPHQTSNVATSLGIPWLFFYGSSCFFSLCDVNASEHGLFEKIPAGNNKEEHLVPGMPVPLKVAKWGEEDESSHAAGPPRAA